ncbi:MAG: putative AMP-dependent ligase/synthetase [Actinomycetia bacterium]|nr:putative AMP-dependent ligase/synthetase [Actinomycetes bacterium]
MTDLYGSRTVWELVERRAELTPDRPMLLDDERGPVTFGDFRRYAERVAAGLVEHGVRPGGTVAWQLPTTSEAVVIWAALARLGVRQVPMLLFYREREVQFILRETAADVVLVPGTYGGVDFTALAGDVPTLDVFSTPLQADPSSLPPAPTEDGERFTYYTSGTTADPKGVRHTDGTLVAGGEAMADALGMTADDIGSIAFPFAHIAGPDYVLAMLVVGFPSVLLERFDPKAAVDVYRRHGVTMAGGSTAFYQALLAVQREQPGEPILPTLRCLSGGGAAMPPAIFHAVRAEIGVPTLHGYAMTEVPMCMMGRWGDPDDLLATTAGPPVRGLEIRIAEDGEIQVRGKVVSPGYTDPALDAVARTDDGWFHTGDIGELHDGRLVVTGRIKDIIIRKGENISAAELENLAATHPAIKDIAVIGVPDEERGELVCAVVEPEPGRTIDLPTLVEHLSAAGIMKQKLPERLELVDAMPRGVTLGKVLKAELRKQFS